MAYNPINVGTVANDGTGDSLRAEGLKINGMFQELYLRAPAGLAGLLAADNATGNYRVAVVADISFAGVSNGLATLDGTGKVPTSQLPAAVLGSLNYQGTWNATTNSPAIPAAASGNKGFYYKVATAGTTNISGITDWQIGDWIVSNGASWDKIDNTDLVSSVAGLTGVITAAGLKTALSIVYADIGGLGTAATYTVGVSAGQVVALDGAGKLPAVDGSQLTGVGGMGTNLLHVQDQKASGTGGGASIAGVQDRSLSTAVYNSIAGASLASNLITLPAGTYIIEGTCPAALSDNHQAWLYNVTASAVLVNGSSEYSSSGGTGYNGTTTRSHIRGRFTLGVSSVLKFQHRTNVAYATNNSGLGLPGLGGNGEIYTEAMIWKVA